MSKALGSSRSKPDVHDMVVVHRRFRRSVAELPDVVSGLSPDDPTRVALVVEAVRFMLEGLEVHHTTEDELLWPLLSKRSPQSAGAVELMREQHHRIDGLVAEVSDALDNLVINPARATRERVVRGLRELEALLNDHMDAEESAMLPLAAEYLTVAEWEELGRASLARLDGTHRVRAFNGLMSIATPYERRALLAKIPLAARLRWHLKGRREHAEWEARLYGA